MSRSVLAVSMAFAATFLAGCSGAKGDTGVPDAGPTSGRLRALTPAGADLGYVYAAFPMNVTFGPTPTAGTLPMLLLKQQPPGVPLPAPVLVYRSSLSGEAVTCTLLYESADCTGTPVVPAAPSGNACLDEAGHAWVAPPAAAARTLTPGSRKIALWDGPTQTVASWSCQTFGGAAPTTVFPGEDRGVPPEIASRIYYVPAD